MLYGRMGILSRFFNRQPELKSYITDYDVTNTDDVRALLMGISTGESINVSAREAYDMSQRNADIGDAVNRISKTISQMIILMQDEEGEIIYNDPMLDIINYPGETRRKSQVFYELTESYLLTNEAWVVARGNINRAPLAIVPIKPFQVSIIFNFSDGMPQTIMTESPFDRRTYERQIIKGKFRYIDSRGLNEIIPIIGATNNIDFWRGRSPLGKLYYDALMSTDGKRHNTSMLQNGMRTSAVISPKGNTSSGVAKEWNDDAISKIQKYIRSFHQGAGNAGSALILGSQADVQGLTQNNKDADFLGLLKITKEDIYSAYQIPLPLILSDAMTLNNYTVALRAFFTDAVFPVFDYIADGLYDGLSPRYNVYPNYRLTFSEIDIRGMRQILIENMKQLKDTEAVSINEIRSTGGFDADDDGDDILVTANKVPLSALGEGPSFSSSQGELTDAEMGNSTDEQIPGLTDDETGTEIDSIPN